MATRRSRRAYGACMKLLITTWIIFFSSSQKDIFIYGRIPILGWQFVATDKFQRPMRQRAERRSSKLQQRLTAIFFSSTQARECELEDSSIWDSSMMEVLENPEKSHG
ncbi:hypothetical protein SCHPADRAFT_909976 [Schizopora paradoxa]|uniref:Uncharacterized protein n=1 Tax=Schizopora paradoxa TaxID=27342 RepID=A0A0H2R6B4_9AGAM|nr:hypothetical protein SCHPADRAFT_909976 [Schizopora paradoxa]